MYNKLLVQVALAHLVSHLHIMTIPALLPLLPYFMDVSFMQLGLALGVFNSVSAVVQAPLGFMVDRVGAQRMLNYALVVGSLSFALLAVWPVFSVLLIAMFFAGLANGVYHPADYALLSQGMSADKMGQAFSIHTFAGFVGAALAPPVLLGLAQAIDMRWAFAVSSAAGVLVLCYLLFSRASIPVVVASKKSTMSDKRPIKIPVLGLMGFVFLFMLLSLSTGSIERFSVSSLVEGFTVPLSTANQGLTWYLVMSAFGVLAGGYLADRTTKHGFIAAAAFALAATFVVLISSVALPAILLITAMAIVGFLTGIVAPSRDMLVRAASPKGAEGRTFGIVSTGFNIGGVVGPVFLGYLLDQHLAKEVMWAIVAFMLLTTIVVLLQEFRSKRQSAS